MPYEFELPSFATPERIAEVLATAPESRLIAVPTHLKRSGIRNVSTTVHGLDFTIAPVTQIEWGSQFALHGTIEAQPDGRSRIRARVELESRPATAPLIVGAFGLLFLLSGSGWGFAWLAFAGAMLLRDHSVNERVSPSTSPEAKFLVDNLVEIIRKADEISALPEP